MNKLAKVQKNGSLANHNNVVDFPMWSSFIDGLFDRVESPLLLGTGSQNNTLPRVNIRDTDESYIVDMAVPGMRKKDFSIELNNGVLRIASNIVPETDYENTALYVRREFGFFQFERTFNLPDTVDEEKIKASYYNGILSVELSKKEEARSKPPRTITVS